MHLGPDRPAIGILRTRPRGDPDCDFAGPNIWVSGRLSRGRRETRHRSRHACKLAGGASGMEIFPRRVPVPTSFCSRGQEMRPGEGRPHPASLVYQWLRHCLASSSVSPPELETPGPETLRRRVSVRSCQLVRPETGLLCFAVSKLSGSYTGSRGLGRVPSCSDTPSVFSRRHYERAVCTSSRTTR